MRKLANQQLKKLKSMLKNFLKNELVVDIFLIGSAIKDKSAPGDIDVMVLLRKKEYKKIEDLLYSIKKTLNTEFLHIEPLVVDNMFNTKIFSSVMHEGFSIKHNKPVSKLLGYQAYVLFTFSLEKLSKVGKVRFAQTIYGRKNDGLLQKEGGKAVGKGAFMVDVRKEEFFREVLQKHKVTFKVKRTFVNN